MIRNIYWAAFPEAIDSDICSKIRENCSKIALGKGRLNSDKESFEDHSIRKSDVGFINQSSWINPILQHYINLANKKIWDFEISDYQTAQYAKYQEGDFYDWHKDEFAKPYSGEVQEWRGKNRKLTAVLNLTPEGACKGGGLGLKDPWGNEINLDESRMSGTVVVFPAYIVHKALPVIAGKRESLTVWALGPSFR